jgi:hypothetical protein
VQTVTASQHATTAGDRPVSSKQATKIVKWDVGSLSTEMPGHACDTDDLLDTPVMQSALKQSVNQGQVDRILAVRQTEHPPTMQEGTNSGPSEEHEQVKYLESLTKCQSSISAREQREWEQVKYPEKLTKSQSNPST